jgi:hypothetical protein
MPPTLYVSEDDAAQPVRAEKFDMQLEGTTRLLLSIETNIAPPAALLAPGLYDDEVETLLLILQRAIVHIDVVPSASPIITTQLAVANRSSLHGRWYLLLMN